MSKWMWLLGAGAGAVILAGAGRKDDKPADDSGDDEDETAGDDSEGGDTPEPKPDEGGEDEPPTGPWIVLPYDQYERGPYTIDLTGLSTGVRWRVYATNTKSLTEAAKDAIKLGAGVEVSDDEARVAANAYVDALGLLPVEPYPLPPKPTPDPPDGLEPDGGVEPPGPALPLPPPLQTGGIGGGPSTLESHPK